MAKTTRPTTPRKRSATTAGKRPKKATVTSIPAAGSLDRDAIALRAYQIFLRRGSTHGDDMADWHAAERELLEELARPPDD